MNRSIGRPVHILSPGPIGQRTGGYVFLRRIAEGLAARGERVGIHALPGQHPWPDEAARLSADAIVGRIPDGAVVLVDGLALPAAANALWMDQYRLRLTALVHHPLHLETGLSTEQATLLRQIEQAALGPMRRVLVPSAATAAAVVALGVPPARIAMVPPGTDRADKAAGSAGGGPHRADGVPQLLSLGTLTPRKGHHLLIGALAALTDLPWRLVLAGSDSRDPACAAALRAAVAGAGLAGRVTITGELDEAGLARLWASSDLFVFPSLHEGYGMAAAEALARGLPVVTTTAGALAEVVPPGAGALVPPGDAGALAAALRPLLADPGVRAAAARAAAAAGALLPDWEDCLDRVRSELGRAVPADQRIERIA
ncbi:glycosyltransferase family 4 protein [Oleisolibacter albus]|uniref:glycosyltransferase family 4 protein n=1 Tax=Oleisolibacter albus TaxID=2171757 RepID=UPI000DF38905|nr:glycosyltransferase family 4 protein [Oleisolibacter albus]